MNVPDRIPPYSPFSRVTIIVQNGKQTMTLIIPKAEDVEVTEAEDADVGVLRGKKFFVEGRLPFGMTGEELPKFTREWKD